MAFTMNKLLPRGRKLFLPLFVVLLLGLTAIPALAASDDVTVTVTIDQICEVTASPTSLTFSGNEVDASDFNNGYSNDEDLVATVKCNTGWKLEIKGTSDYFSYDGSGTDPQKPVSDIQWIDGGSTWYDLSTTDAEVMNDSNPTDGYDVSLDVRVKLSWTDDIPGTYTYEYIRLTASNVV
jgi:hypothetical protein